LAWVERVVLNALANGTAALPPDILAPSAIQVPSVQAGLAFFGEVDLPLSLKRNSRVSEVTACV